MIKKTFADMLQERGDLPRYFVQHSYDMWHQSAITISHLLSKIKEIEDPVGSEIIELLTNELHEAVEKENKFQQQLYEIDYQERMNKQEV